MAKNLELKRGPIGNSVAYFRDAYTELGKVHFPSRKETMQWLMLCVAMIVVFSFFLGLTDLIVGKIMRQILT